MTNLKMNVPSGGTEDGNVMPFVVGGIVIALVVGIGVLIWGWQAGDPGTSTFAPTSNSSPYDRNDGAPQKAPPTPPVRNPAL